MSRGLTIVLLGLITLVIGLSSVYAEIPRIISYQGRLTDNLGAPVTGVKELTFRLYNQSGVQIWSSGPTNVTCAEGLFSVRLGASPQPALPSTTVWAMDTLLTLGIQVTGDAELTPRARLAAAPYAYSALHGGGWVVDQIPNTITLEDPNDRVGVGTSSPLATLHVQAASGDSTGIRINQDINTVGSDFALLALRGPQAAWPGYDGAIMGIASDANSVGGSFASNNNNGSLISMNFGTGPAFASQITGTTSPCLAVYDGLGILSQTTTNIRAGRFMSSGTTGAHVLEAEYTGTNVYDYCAVWGKSRPADYYGIGGEFEGGYMGVRGICSPTGYDSYYGLYGQIVGGSGTSFGVYGNVEGYGTNYGVYGSASLGTTNYAGYFNGDINVTGTIIKSASVTRTDHPLDPDNMYLQTASVESSEMLTVYSGNVTADASGSAVVTLPDYVQASNRDFRYQLTCIGGYAPVYIEKEIANNQFTISGGQPGMKISWQLTGTRNDAWAQAHPIEGELAKTAAEQGKYVHPELFGKGIDQMLNPPPDQTPEGRAKRQAIEESRAAQAKQTAAEKPPVRPLELMDQQ